jgi:capsular exopolysaccharide synthesis family protein
MLVVAEAPSTPAAARLQVTVEMLEQSAFTAWEPDPRTMLFFSTDERVQGREEFRTLHSRLLQIRERQPVKRILVTSALPKEGKSFVAANLAQACVQKTGNRVLLIDADLRAPSLHGAFGAHSTPGLSDYLLGGADEVAVLQRGAMEGLFFLPAGRTVGNAPELVNNGRWPGLLARLEALFDWIIVDAPTAAAYPDAGELAKFCDGVLMVQRSQTESSGAARKARLEFPEEQLLGFVLNGNAAESPS